MTNGSERDERRSSTAFTRGVIVVAIAVVVGGLVLRSVSNPDDVRFRSSASTTTTTVTRTGPSSTLPPSTVATHAPAEVKVLVVNAVDPKKAVAGPAATQLVSAGYSQASPRDAPQSVPTAVYFTPGYDADAAQIAAVLHLPPAKVQPLPSPPPPQIGAVQGANVVVVLGPDAGSG